MEWYNEPGKWNFADEKLSMEVTPRSDYWRKTHNGFIRDDGPFYYCLQGGEFEVSTKISGDYRSCYDQSGLMLRIDEKQWIKTGIEYVDGIYNFSTVVTRDFSNWNIIALGKKSVDIWVKAIRRKDAVEIFYSTDGENFQLSNQAYFPGNIPAMVGMMAASPDADSQGFKATFENFTIHLLPGEK